MNCSYTKIDKSHFLFEVFEHCLWTLENSIERINSLKGTNEKEALDFYENRAYKSIEELKKLVNY